MVPRTVSLISLLAGGLKAAHITIHAGGSVVLESGGSGGSGGGDNGMKVAELEAKLQRLQDVVDMMMNSTTTPFELKAEPSPPSLPPPPMPPPPSCTFKQFRIKATKSPPPEVGNSGWWILGQLEFVIGGASIPTTSEQGTCIESSHYSDNSWACPNAFTSDHNENWHSNVNLISGNLEEYVGFSFTAPTSIDQYVYHCSSKSNYCYSYSPRSFQFQARNSDSDNWQILDTVTDYPWATYPDSSARSVSC